MPSTRLLPASTTTSRLTPETPVNSMLRNFKKETLKHFDRTKYKPNFVERKSSNATYEPLIKDGNP